VSLTTQPLDLTQFPEIEPDEFHPQNDEFNRNIEQVKRVIMAHQRGMTPKHVQMVKYYFAGTTQVQIAEQVSSSPNTVGRVINSDRGQRLVQLLHYMAEAIAGPSIAQRKAMLSRIAQRAEQKDPKTAIVAIAELNKMGVTEFTQENDDNGPQQVNITINNNHFPRTELDG
jgi:hypothetical protein